MFKQQLRASLSPFVFLTVFTGASVAQQAPSVVETQPAMQCGGQHECVEDRPLTPAEAQASRSYPHVAQPQDPEKVAATRPTESSSATGGALGVRSIP